MRRLQDRRVHASARFPGVGGVWVAVKELKLSCLGFRVYYPPIVDQMEKKMENEMETGGI